MPYQADGQSMIPLLESIPDNQWDNESFSYFKEGISMKTPEYRITQFYRDEQPDVELYNHLLDPLESVNIASDFPAIRDSLLRSLEKGNTGLFN